MSVLTVEQVSSIREKLNILEEKLNLLGYHVENGQVIGDSSELSDDSINNVREYGRLSNLLLENSFAKEIDTNKIDIGTRFYIQFEGDELEKTLLVDTLTGTNIGENYISAESPVGKSIIGKKQGEKFEAKTGIGTIVKGRIVSIINDAKDSLRFLRTEDVIEEYITPSQKRLLQEEISRFENTNTSSDRINIVNKMLSESKVVDIPDTGKIGIGSKFNLMFSDSVKEGKKFELIKKAVSDEISDSYIEMDSQLGTKLVGLTENETFECDTKTGKVKGKVLSLKK